MTAGASAADQAAAARHAAARRQQEADRLVRAADAWQAGSDGERQLAAPLDDLAGDGYRHLPDRAMPGSNANIDHLLVGPAGVFILDAKAWTGVVSVDRNVLRQGVRRRTQEVESARNVALTVAAAMERVTPKVDVRPALCFVGEAQLVEPVVVDRVKLLNADDVVSWIQRFTATLDRSRIDDVEHLLRSTFPAKTHEPVSDIATEAPADLVVYLVPWRKSGRDRLYVRSTQGSDVGYLDLVTGHCSSPSAEWEAVLAQLLPHYLKGDTPGMGRDDLSDEARGVIRTFLDTILRRRPDQRMQERPIIVCYRWKRRGKDLLYLSRIEPGGHKVDLGSFDLEFGTLRATKPGVAATLGYCGQRFQQLEMERLGP